MPPLWPIGRTQRTSLQLVAKFQWNVQTVLKLTLALWLGPLQIPYRRSVLHLHPPEEAATAAVGPE